MPSRDDLHDLLTPLAVMKGAISIVLKHGDRLDPAERDRWLQLAIEQSDELNAVMNELDADPGPDQIRLELPSSGSRELIEEPIGDRS